MISSKETEKKNPYVLGWDERQCVQQLDHVMECTRGRVELQQVFLTKMCSQSMEPMPVAAAKLEN
jgi:hypothetical protein